MLCFKLSSTIRWIMSFIPSSTSFSYFFFYWCKTFDLIIPSNVCISKTNKLLLPDFSGSTVAESYAIVLKITLPVRNSFLNASSKNEIWLESNRLLTTLVNSFPYFFYIAFVWDIYLLVSEKGNFLAKLPTLLWNRLQFSC